MWYSNVYLFTDLVILNCITFNCGTCILIDIKTHRSSNLEQYTFNRDRWLITKCIVTSHASHTITYNHTHFLVNISSIQYFRILLKIQFIQNIDQTSLSRYIFIVIKKTGSIYPTTNKNFVIHSSCYIIVQ